MSYVSLRGFGLLLAAMLTTALVGHAAEQPVAKKKDAPAKAQAATPPAKKAGPAKAPTVPKKAAPIKAPPVKPPPTPINPNDQFPFRTDKFNGHLPWYEPQPGVFPPVGASHYIGGELTSVDAWNRSGVLRPDRTDEQSRAFIDLPLAFALLPYGSIYYRGAPASLKDIPLGTHLHGEFFWNSASEADPLKKQAVTDRTISTFHAFDRVLRLEDDFSRSVRLGRYRRIEAIDLSAGTISVIETDRAGQQPAAKPVTYKLDATTTVWKGRGIGELSDLAVGQLVTLNLTNCTLFGPGDCTEIWADEVSRTLATQRQLEVHRRYIRHRGLPARVDSVDHSAGTVTLTLFDGFDTSLTSALVIPYLAATVADDALRVYDQVNVSKGGPITAVKQVPLEPGCGGVQITFRPSDLLEGFRPQRTIRVFLATWPITQLPREEELRR